MTAPPSGGPALGGPDRADGAPTPDAAGGSSARSTQSASGGAARPPKKLYIGILVLLGLVVWRMGLAPVDGSQEAGVVAVEGATMGTTWSVKVVAPEDPPEPAALRSLCQKALDAVDGAMSTYKSDSELSLFNRHREATPLQVSAPTARVFALAEDTSRLTGGAFDVTVGPLVDAWGFGPGRSGEAPDEARVAALRRSVGWQLIHTDVAGLTLRKDNPDVSADLSAIAKGFAVDQVAAALAAAGHRDFMVEVGGEVSARGLNARSEPWRIGVERPQEGPRAVHTVVPLLNRAMATSGDYRNYRDIDGLRVSHTIDPRTGHPITHGLASVTVVDETCARADALATALNVLGPDEGLALAERQGLAAMFLVRIRGDATTLELRQTHAFAALGATTLPTR